MHFKYFGLLPSLPRRHCTFKLLPLMNYDFGKLYCGLDFKLIFQRDMFFTETFKSIAVSLISGRPSTWSQIYQNAVRDFFRSDHYRFWNAEPSLPAVFLTDSANFRGYMQQCYHGDCDDMSHVTSKRLEFLGNTAQNLVEVASSMTNEKCPGKVVIKKKCIRSSITTVEKMQKTFSGGDLYHIWRGSILSRIFTKPH